MRSGRILRRQDLLLEKSGGGEQQAVGAVVMYDLDVPAVCSNFVARIETNEDTSPRFITYVHAALYGLGLNRRSIKQTTGIQNLDQQSYLDETVVLPALAQQKRLADYLDRKTAAIDALIAKKERLIELLEEKRQALITQAVTKGLDPNVPMKDSGIDWLGQIPAHWQTLPLRRLVRCLDGKRIPLNAIERSEMQGPIPYWGANCVVDHVNRSLFNETLVLLGEDGAPFFDKSKPVAFHVSGPVWVNNHAHVLRPLGVNAIFLTHVLNVTHYTEFVDGSTRDKLTQTKMNRIPVPMPPPQEQDRIAAHLSALSVRSIGMVRVTAASRDKLREYRQALITAAVTGKIEVPGAA